MGYHAYRHLTGAGQADAALPFLRSAAKHGHALAARELALIAADGMGILAPIARIMARFKHERRIVKMKRDNPNDLRLK